LYALLLGVTTQGPGQDGAPA